jgi:hypothetical protein
MFRKISLFLLLLLPFCGFASHLRSGEIAFVPVPGMANTYEITVTVYTNVGFQANGSPTPDLPTIAKGAFTFGDGTSNAVAINRSNGGGEFITPSIKKNIFIFQHTYKTNGTFTLSYSASARNAGILNIPNSVSMALYVEAQLTIGKNLKPMSSPVLSMPPIGDGCLNSIYKINPGAIDPDGDILRFSLMKCQRSQGSVIPGYLFPNELDPSGLATFTINPKTGVIIWDSPKDPAGEYNISMKIEKLRNGVVIGYVIRDMQVTVAYCDNHPPFLNPVNDTCVEFGSKISYKVTSTDVDNDSLELTSTGMPYNFVPNNASFILDPYVRGSASATFSWQTDASNISKNPYQVYYKVTDFHPGSNVSLNDFETNFITVTARKPVKNLSTTLNQSQRGFNLVWDPSVYPEATGYYIYRSTGSSPFVTDSCSMGVPFTSNYSLIDSVDGHNTNKYTDSNYGKGLASGYDYCYIVTAVFANGAESAPSDPFCKPLMIPFIKVLKDTLPSCMGNTVTLDSTIIQFESADLSTKYNWSSSPDFIITNADKQYPSAKMEKVGYHYITIVATSGAYIDSAKIYFYVNPIPIPKITYKDLSGIPQNVIFYNRSTYAVSAEWQIDGTSSSNMDSVLHTFDKNGNYRIYLKVFNSFGCPDTTSIIFSAAMKGVEMPNAFEPESSNSSFSTFLPKAIGLQTYFFGVWDLWGNLVWSTDKLINTSPLEGWDGNDSKGKKMPSQNYIWRMKATFIDGTVWKGIKDRNEKFHSEGTFTLLR